MTSVAFQTTSIAKQTVSVKNIRTRGGPEMKKETAAELRQTMIAQMPGPCRWGAWFL